MQHALNSTLELSSSKKRQLGPNRRQYQRIESSIRLTLVKLVDSDQIVQHRPADAKSLDISKGGMRLATDIPVDQDTAVELKFDDSFSSNLTKTIANVEWCNKQIDDPGYQIGISFKDKEAQLAMDAYLGSMDSRY